MTAPSNSPDPLVKFGFTAREAAALRVLWGSRHIVYLLEAVPNTIHDLGGTAEDAIDFIDHAVEEPATGMYFHRGFTAHQAALIERDPVATNNLYDRHAAGVPEFLEAAAPRDFIVNVLRIAKSSSEADWYLRRYQQAVAEESTDNGPDTVQSLTDEVGTLAGHHPAPEFRCGCP